jgi:hypothetical protein
MSLIEFTRVESPRVDWWRLRRERKACQEMRRELNRELSCFGEGFLYLVYWDKTS